MATIKAHKESVRNLVDDINEKLRTDTIVKKQKLIGFACSEASCDLLAILLHKRNLIDPGFNVNHRFFASKKIASRKFDFEFPKKQKLLPLLVNQEKYRNNLCYGTPNKEDIVKECIENFFEIKTIIEKEMGEKI